MALTAAQRELLVTIREQREGNALVTVARDVEQLSRGVDATGGAMNDMEGDAKRLNAEIEKSSARIKDLHKQFLATGDTSLFGDIRKEETRLRNLQKTFKALTPDFVKAGEDLGATLGTSVTNSFFKQVTGAFSGEGGIGGMGAAIAAIGSLIAVSAAPLGAILAGSVVGAVGAGGLVGGVVAASQDPRVQDAFHGLVDDLKKEFFGAGSSFVEPIIKSIGILAVDIDKLDLGKTFALAAPDLEVIVGGLGDLLKNIMPGLNTLLSRSGPFADAAAKGFGAIGTALAEFLDEVSASPGAIEGLELLFAVLAGTVKALGVGLKFLSDVYSGFVNIAGGVSSALSETLDIVGLHSGFIAKGARALQESAAGADNAGAAHKGLGYVFRGAAVDAQKETDALKRQNDELQNTINLLDQAINQALSLDNAQLALSKDMKDLSTAVAENGQHWNDNTDAAFNNRQAILGALGDLERVRDQEIKNGVAVADANAEYEAGFQKIVNYAGALGATKAQLDAIKGRYDIVLVVTTIGDVVSGVTKKLAGLIPHFDSGGVMPGPAGAPGLAVLHGGERVLTPAQQASSGGGQTVQVVMSIDPSGASDSMGAAMLKFLRDHVRFNGGSADVAFS